MYKRLIDYLLRQISDLEMENKKLKHENKLLDNRVPKIVKDIEQRMKDTEFHLQTEIANEFYRENSKASDTEDSHLDQS